MIVRLTTNIFMRFTLICLQLLTYEVGHTHEKEDVKCTISSEDTKIYLWLMKRFREYE